MHITKVIDVVGSTISPYWATDHEVTLKLTVLQVFRLQWIIKGYISELSKRALDELAGDYASKVHFQHFTWPEINRMDPTIAGALTDIARTTHSYLSEV